MWGRSKYRRRKYLRGSLGEGEIPKNKSQKNPKSQEEKSKQRLADAVSESDTANYDLEERTFQFAKRVRAFVKLLPRTVCNREDVAQLIRSSGSVGANYIEANDALSHKDFIHRARISRRECKESRYWLRLLDVGDESSRLVERDSLVVEANELKKILSAIIRKCE